MFKKLFFLKIGLLIALFCFLPAIVKAEKLTICSCDVALNYFEVTSAGNVDSVYNSKHFFKIEEGAYDQITFSKALDGVDSSVGFSAGIEPKCDTCEKEFAVALADQINQNKKGAQLKGASAVCKKTICEKDSDGNYINCESFVNGQVEFKDPFPTEDNPKKWKQTDPDQSVELETKNKAAAIFECKEGCGVLTLTASTTISSNATALFHISALKEYNKLFYSSFTLQSATNQELKCGSSAVATGTYYFQVDFDCSKQMEPKPSAAFVDCKKVENLETCKTMCENEYCEWKNQCVSKPVADTTAPAEPTVSTFDYNKGYFEGQYPVPKNYTGALPPCAFSGTCRDVNDLVSLIIRWASGFFAILGTFAFAFFIYGGFVIMLSLGNAEKVKKGQQTLVAAVIGLFIAFSAYLAIDFMLDALNVSDVFRGIK